MAKRAVTIATDENGYFHRTEQFRPPMPFPITVRASAVLRRPDGTAVSGSIDVDAADGDPSNEERKFVLQLGESVSLGSWRLDRADNILVLTGRTVPPRPNSEVEVELEISF